MTNMKITALAIVSVAVIIVTGSVWAQDSSGTVRRIIEGARRANPALKVRTDSMTGMPTSIRGLRPVVDPNITLGASRDASGRASDADIIRATEFFFSSGELAAAFATKNQRSKIEAIRVRQDPDLPGQSIVHVQQRVDGVPVFGSSGRVSVSPSLAVTQLTATFSTVDVDTTTPDIKQERAINVARRRLRAILTKRSRAKRARDPSLDRLRASIESAKANAKLVIYDPALMRTKGSKPGPARLSWLTAVDSFRFFVDARTAEVLFFYMDQRWVTLRQIFDLEKKLQFPGAKVIDDASGVRREPLAADARYAYENSGRVTDYFVRMFGRNGLLEKGDSEVLTSFVRYGDVKNAYWCSGVTFDCPKADAMVYGTATSSAIDVVAHEMTHGVVAVEAKLTYANESGAVNESFADIFGTLIEFHVQPSRANWVLGDEIPGYSPTSPIRSMADPNLADKDGKTLFDRSKPYGPNNRGQPDHYADYVQREDPICETTRDYYTGCVHFNSGIFNKFAFLIAEGGRHRGAVVKGIGRKKLGRIAYRALVAHLNPSSGLKESAETFHTSCSELARINVANIVSEDCNRVREAQHAVGLVIAGS